MWDEKQVHRFTFEDRAATVVTPSCKPNGRLIWKTEYFLAFPNFEEAMVERGYTLCFLEHPTRWAPMSELEVCSRFLTKVSGEYGTENRAVCVGMSCGGLLACKFAEFYPKQVSVLNLDAPVLNILSMLGFGDGEYEQAFCLELSDTYGLSRSGFLTFRESPIDFLPNLIENDIPIILLYGNADNTVVYGENGKVLENYYRAHNGRLKVVCRSMCGHHPHGLENPTPIIEFVEANQ